MLNDYEAVLTFWFGPDAEPYWFRRNPGFDDAIREGFLGTYRAARDGQLLTWEALPRGVLALVIVLDQFPRNLFRGTPEAFATDAMALRIASDAVDRGFDAALEPREQGFLYMPFMHSENLAEQRRAVALFRAAGLTKNLPHAEQHHEIIERFGRFPHRNAVLGRDTTVEEQRYLDSPGAFRG